MIPEEVLGLSKPKYAHVGNDFALVFLGELPLRTYPCHPPVATGSPTYGNSDFLGRH